MVNFSPVLETGVLICGRIALVLACRRFLLRVLYADLKNLNDHRGDVELEELPTPATVSTPNAAEFASYSRLLHSKIARTVFSWVFAECCMIFVLLILQGMDVFSSRTRLAHWKFTLSFLVITILVVIPVCISILLSTGKTGSLTLKQSVGPRAIVYLVPVALYLLALSYIPLPDGLQSPDLTTSVISRLIVLGTVVLGILSGVGAVNNSWDFIPFLSRRGPVPTDAEIQASEYTLSSIRSDLHQRRIQMDRRHSSETQASWLSRMGSSIRGGDSLTQEIKGLESLEYHMSKNVDTLRQRRDAAIYSATWQGQFWNLAGRLFAVYCITRILSCLYNIIFLPSLRASSTMNYSDVISSILAYGITHLSSASIQSETIASVARQLSLLFVGIMIFTSVRYVLRGVSRLLSVSSRSLGASLMLLFLAQIMAIYLLSTVVQMRTSFPPPPRASPIEDDDPPVNLFSTIPKYELFGSLFDWAFLLTVSVSCFVRWGADKVTGVGDT